jgi:hypothetical protein
VISHVQNAPSRKIWIWCLFVLFCVVAFVLNTRLFHLCLSLLSLNIMNSWFHSSESLSCFVYLSYFSRKSLSNSVYWLFQFSLARFYLAVCVDENSVFLRLPLIFLLFDVNIIVPFA